VYFVADDGAHGIELWRSDGTALGTELVKDVYPGATGSSPTNLTNINGQLFFSATDPDGGLEMWKSDGTAAGTARLADVFTGPAASSPTKPVSVNGDLLFGARDRVHSYELFKIPHGATCGDGTPPMPARDATTATTSTATVATYRARAPRAATASSPAGEECDDGNAERVRFVYAGLHDQRVRRRLPELPLRGLATTATRSTATGATTIACPRRAATAS
jgi:ELWxxDGT repeat protein